MLESLCTMVSVVKWLRRQVVALEIEGSNPFAHPTTPSPNFRARLNGEYANGVPI